MLIPERREEDAQIRRKCEGRLEGQLGSGSGSGSGSGLTSQGLPATTKRQGEGPGMDSPSEPLEELTPPTSWFQTPGLRNHEKLSSYCFKAPSLWSFVTAATGNKYTALITEE